MKSITDITLSSSEPFEPEEAKVFIDKTGDLLTGISDNFSELIKLKIKQQAESKTADNSLMIQKEIDRLEITMEFIRDIFNKNPVNIKLIVPKTKSEIKDLEADIKVLKKQLATSAIRFLVKLLFKYIIIFGAFLGVLWLVQRFL